MRQQTLASQASFEQFGRKGKRELFLDQIEQVARGPSYWRWWSLTIPRRATAAKSLP